MTDGTIYNIPFPELNLSLTSDIILSGPNSATKLMIKNALESIIFNVDTSTGSVRIGGSSSYTDINGSLVNVVNTNLPTTLTVSGKSDSTVIELLNLNNSSTAGLSGTSMRMTGHTGMIQTNYVMRYNGSNVNFRNDNASGSFTFDKLILPHQHNTVPFGNSGLRWQNVFTQLLNVAGTSTLAGISNSGGYTQTGTSANTLTGITTATTAQSGITSDRIILSNTGTGASTGTGIRFEGHSGSGTTSGSVQLNGSNVLYNCDNTPGMHVFNRAIRPDADNTYSCGNTFNRWSSIHGVNGNFTGDVSISSTDSSNKLSITNNSSNPIFNVNTSTGSVRIGGGSSYTDINGSAVNVINTTGSGNWGFMKIEGAFNGQTTDCLYLTNNGTGNGTGTYMQFDGHDGSIVQNSRIGFNGNNMSYTNNNSIGEHVFNRNVVPTSNLYSCGKSTSRWSNVFTTLLNASSTANLTGITNNGSYTQTGSGLNTFTSQTNILTNGTAMSAISQNNTSGIMFNINGGLSSGGLFYENTGADEGLILTSHTFPSSTATFDLGTVNRRWNVLYADAVNIRGEFTSSQAINGSASSRLTLTNSGTGAGTGVSINMNGHNGTTATNGSIMFNNANMTLTIPAGGNYILNATTRPSTNNTLSLGTSGNRWSTVFGNTFDATGVLNSTIVNRATFGNIGTGAGTGTGITFSGHNGSSVTTSTIQFNGTNMIYNSASGGEHTFGTTIRPITNGTGSLGTSANRWADGWLTAGAISTSDSRAKNTITDELLGLDFINQLRPVKYKFNVQRNETVINYVPRVDEDGNPMFEQIPVLNENGEYTYDENGNQIFIDGENQVIDTVQSIVPIPGTKFYHGLVAQEIDEALTNNGLTTDDFAGLNKDDPNSYGVSYTEFVAPIIKAIQELKAIVDTQANQIASQAQQITELQNQIETLIGS
jgi:hypothetical protein